MRNARWSRRAGAEAMKAAGIAGALAGVLALAGCNRAPTVTATNEKPSAVASKVAAASAQSGPARFEPGQWETRVAIARMDLPGLPPEAQKMMQQSLGKPRTVSSCLTPEQAARPDSKFFGQADKACTYDHFTMGDGRIDATITCTTPAGRQTMTMAGTYAPDSYDATMQMQGEGPGGRSMSMDMTISSHRVGACTDKDPA